MITLRVFGSLACAAQRSGSGDAAPRLRGEGGWRRAEVEVRECVKARAVPRQSAHAGGGGRDWRRGRTGAPLGGHRTAPLAARLPPSLYPSSCGSAPSRTLGVWHGDLPGCLATALLPERARGSWQARLWVAVRDETEDQVGLPGEQVSPAPRHRSRRPRCVVRQAGPSWPSLLCLG